MGGSQTQTVQYTANWGVLLLFYPPAGGKAEQIWAKWWRLFGAIARQHPKRVEEIRMAVSAVKRWCNRMTAYLTGVSPRPGVWGRMSLPFSTRTPWKGVVKPDRKSVVWGKRVEIGRGRI